MDIGPGASGVSDKTTPPVFPPTAARLFLKQNQKKDIKIQMLP
jgi:hypothetical protein